MSNVGAWFLGGYRKGMEGTLGESLDLASLDNLGWSIRSWKYELSYSGFGEHLKLDLPVFGDAMQNRVRDFQKSVSIPGDGIIGATTAPLLLRRRLVNVASQYDVSFATLRGIVWHESGFDVGAIGYVDHLDRGLTQKHVYPGGDVNLSQAVRPAAALPRLASQIQRLSRLLDEDAAIVSWNIGEGGAEWWFAAGKPTSGSPSWWTGGDDLAARATAYLAAVRSG